MKIDKGCCGWDVWLDDGAALVVAQADAGIERGAAV